MKEKHSDSANSFILIILVIIYILLNILSPEIFHNPYLILLDVILLVGSFLGFAFLYSKNLVHDSTLKLKQIFPILIARLFGFRVPVLLFRKDMESVAINRHRFSRSTLLNIQNGVIVAVSEDSQMKYLQPGFHRVTRSNSPIFFISTDPQILSLGPKSENPFSAFNGNVETRNSYLQRLEHRHETQGFTSDGVEIVPNIDFSFEIQLRSPAHRFEKAIEPQIEIRNFTSLITKSVCINIADLWREELSRYSLAKVFSEKTDSQVLEKIESLIPSKMIPPELPPEYHSFQKLISLKLTSLCIQNLRIHPRIERKLIQDWGKYNLDHLKQENTHSARQVEFLETQFRRKKAMQFAAQISQEWTSKEVAADDLPGFVNSLVGKAITVMKPRLEKQGLKLADEIESLQIHSGLNDENGI